MSHAAEQIMSTREIFDKNYGIKKFVARIVCSKAKTTKLNSNTFKKMKKVMKMLKKRQKQYGRPEHFVYINTHRPIEKQVFTAVRELGHILKTARAFKGKMFLKRNMKRTQ